MRFSSKWITSLCLLSIGSTALVSAAAPGDRAEKKSLEINLKEPVIKGGRLTTYKGGVIRGEDLRIQAQNIELITKTEEGETTKLVVAQGDLLLEVGGSAFVGERLEYNLLTKTGTLYNGVTFIDVWFFGGECITLDSDGTYHIDNAYITTSSGEVVLWDICSKNVTITCQDHVTARSVRLRGAGIPLLYLPIFKANLRFFQDPPVRYKILWDSGLGPRISMRYRLYSWNEFSLFARLDYRWKRGFGGAIETDYNPPDSPSIFQTKSYAAHDKFFQSEEGTFRYRFQGLYHDCFNDGRTELHLCFDKLHDPQMVGDFHSADFEVNTQKETLFWIHQQENNTFATFRLQPRINDFQTLNQELPSLLLGIRPFTLGPTGIVSQNRASLAYLDYVFADDLHSRLNSRHALRIETSNDLYRPFHLGSFHLTPRAGLRAIYNNNNPHDKKQDHHTLDNNEVDCNKSEGHKVGQGVITYGGTLNTHLYKRYCNLTHQLTPYLTFTGISKPLAGTNDVIIFNMQDGLHALNQLRFGLQNTLYTSCLSPDIELDLFANAFFGTTHIPKTIPKAYAHITLNRPTYALFTETAWNLQEKTLDHFNIRTLYTASQDLAFGLEFRYRSPYDFRKANHSSFIMDAARPFDDLLDSPLSDRRFTVLTHAYANLSPRWGLHFQSHHGWGRINHRSYNAARLDLYTLLTTSWRLRLSFEHTPSTNRVTFGFNLIPSP